MCFDGVARVSRAAAQLAFFVAVALDVYQGKAIWNVYIDSLFLNALPVPMLATGFFIGFSLGFSWFFGPRGLPSWTSSWSYVGARLERVLGGSEVAQQGDSLLRLNKEFPCWAPSWS